MADGERDWEHLAHRPHPWRRQLSLKDRRMTVRQLVGTVLANRWSPREAAANLDLPVEAVCEAFMYAYLRHDLLDAETRRENDRMVMVATIATGRRHLYGPDEVTPEMVEQAKALLASYLGELEALRAMGWREGY